MKLLALLLCVCTLLSGCSMWMDGSYHSVTLHPPEKGDAKQESVTVESLEQLPAALMQQVEQGSASVIIYCPGEQQELETAMAAAVEELSKSNGLFAYAVDDVLYEIGDRNSQMAISAQITYRHEKQAIQNIHQGEDMHAVSALIGKALENCEAGVVLRVKQFGEMDFTQFVQDYVDTHPQYCIELPQVAVMLYPETGSDRVIELTFTYQTSREALRNMQEVVLPVFSSAKNYVNANAEPMEQCSQLFAFLMGRDTYTVKTSLTPAYSLLSHGVGDSKAFAVVYAAMCRQSGLDCQVISGTRDGEPWCWNVVKIAGSYYYLDLLQCRNDGGFHLRTQEEMSRYVWDYSAFEG